MIEEAEKAVEEEKAVTPTPDLPEADSKKKTYMTKDSTGNQQVKTREQATSKMPNKAKALFGPV